MRRIYIDKKLEQIVETYSKDPFHKRRSDFTKPTINLENLKSELDKNTQYSKYSEYINKIIKEYDTLNKLKPNEIENKKIEFDKILTEKNLKVKINGIQFYKKIVEAMRYEDLRKKDFIPYLKDLKIKSCVYCNAQLTIVTEKNKTTKKVHVRLELDHYYPKSKFPFLCTSFYNLYPVCSSCNKIKSYNDDTTEFVLYTEENNDLDIYKFRINQASVLTYLDTRDFNSLEFEFKSFYSSNKHNKTFDIQGIYETQKDIIEELVHKKEAYTKLYKEGLVKEYGSLFTDKAIINRLLIGNYVKPEEIHKRPMSKFIQDIAKDLDLI